jgi:hypothetical protein
MLTLLAAHFVWVFSSSPPPTGLGVALFVALETALVASWLWLQIGLLMRHHK